MHAKKRILVIDDDPITRDAVAEVLQEEGYEAAVAANGDDGIAQFTIFEPHLVMADLDMPRSDGHGVVTHVQRVSPTTPIIIFTNEIAIDAMRKAQDLGVAAHLNKPFELTDMLDLLMKLL